MTNWGFHHLQEIDHPKEVLLHFSCELILAPQSHRGLRDNKLPNTQIQDPNAYIKIPSLNRHFFEQVYVIKFLRMMHFLLNLAQ